MSGMCKKKRRNDCDWDVQGDREDRMRGIGTENVNELHELKTRPKIDLKLSFLSHFYL